MEKTKILNKRYFFINNILLLLIFIIGSIGLYSWFTGNLILASVSRSYITMAQSTSFIFCVISVLLFFYLNYNNSKLVDLLIKTLLSIIILYCCFITYKYFFSFPLKLENFFIAEPIQIGDVFNGKMSPVTAVLFILYCINIFLLYLKDKKSKLFSDIIDITTLVVSFIFLIGYLFQAPLLFDSKIIPVALPTAICFLILSLTFININGLPLNFGSQKNLTYQLSRSFVPLVIAIIILQDYIDNIIFHSQENIALFVLIFLFLSIVISIVLIIANSYIIDKKIKASETLLREKEEQNRIVLDTAMDGFWLTDLKGNIIEVNTTYSNMSGYSIEEIKTMNISDFDVFETKNEIVDRIQYIINEGQERFETKHRRKDGSIYDVQVSAQYKHIYNGCMVSFIHDITSSKQIEEKLLDNSNTLKEILIKSYEFIDFNIEDINYEKIADSILEISGAKYCGFNVFEENGLDFTTVALAGINDKLLKVSSYLGYEVVNKKWEHDPVRAEKIKDNTITKFDSLHELTGIVISNKISTLIEKTFDLGYVYIVQIRKNKKPVGDFTLMYKRGDTMRNRELVELFANQIGLFIERKKAEEKLRENEEKFRSLFMAIPVPTYLWQKVDNEFKLIEYNENADQFTKGEIINLIGAKASELYKDNPQIINELDICLKQKITIEREMDFYLKTTNENKYLNVKYAYVPPDLIIVYTEDITERKQAEEILKTNENKYRNLFNNVQVGIYRTKLDGSAILDFNEQYLNIYEYTREEMLGNPSSTFWFDPKEREEMVVKLKRYGNVEGFECRMLTKSGKVKNCLTSVKLYPEEGILEGSIIDITERKQTEEALKQSETLLRSIAETTSDVIFVKDRECRFIFINPAGCRVNGKTMDQLIGYSKADFHSNPSEVARFTADDMRIIESGNMETIEEEVSLPDGSIHTFLTTKVPRRDGHGNIIGLIGVAHDITERKQAELELKNVNRLYSVLSNANKAIIYVKDKQELYNEVCRIAIENGNFRMAWIGEVDEDTNKIIPVSWAGFVNGYLDTINIDLNDEKRSSGPTGLAFKSGAHHISTDIANNPEMVPWKENAIKNGYYSTIAFPLWLFGKVIGAFTIYSDKTYFFNDEEVSLLDLLAKDVSNAIEFIELEILRRETTQALKENESFLKETQQITKLGTYALDITKGIWTSSEILDNIFGIDPDYDKSIEGWVAIIHPEWQKIMNDYFINEVLGTKTNFDKEYKIINQKTQTEHWVHGIGELKFDDNNGNPIIMIGTIRDITEQKQAESDLIKAKEKAEESDRLKSAFLANMSHEIRTPMNGILGFADLLKDPHLTGEDQLKYINIIQKSGIRMLNIINDIISISKIESGQMEVSISDTNINEQLDYIYTFFKPEAANKGIILSYHKPLPFKDALIKTDREKLYGILTNLVKNAIKYTDVGYIDFGYILKDNYVEFYVKDSGIGVPIDRQEAIFERFIQADIEDKRALQGAGLGLSITKAYIEMLGGKIWIESEEEKGSVFYFTIPYNKEKEEETTIKNIVQREDKEVHSNNLKILIVEDDEASDLLITRMLKIFSQEILHVRTGVEAVEACRNNSDIDLIFMDINIPEIDGYEATRQIRQFNKDVIIIAQTAYALIGDKEKAIKEGCNNYISKPIDSNLLKELINKYFKQP